ASTTYTAAQQPQPQFINRLFQIQPLKSIFYLFHFISIDKQHNPNSNQLLPQIQNTFPKTN
ncbi:NifU N-terminal domain-containing protein, partial [Staphylococcus epidermidis]|uniref:NifU N-terminal domain-containing protein n=1 Tax=Staphylococcus epidermidis TaxID=1282 RepID=UPI0011A8A720